MSLDALLLRFALLSTVVASGATGLDLAAQLDESASIGEAPSGAKSKPSRTLVYKTVGDVELRLHVFDPPGLAPGDRRAAIVFFHGGSWVGGDPNQFYPQCRHLASRGMVAISAEYRLKSRHGTTPFDCVRDGKSALRWVRAHAAELGIDPERIAAGGGSAGGHVAAAVATVAGLDEHGEDRSVSCVPAALALFNPVYDNGPGGWGHAKVRDRYWEISPLHNVRRGIPPAIVFFGTKDRLVPVRTAKNFQRAMLDAGSRSELVLFDGEGHGFFNPGRGNGRGYPETLAALDRFLTSLGFLDPSPDGDAELDGHDPLSPDLPGVVIADNRAYGSLHRAGYNGVSELLDATGRNLFVPFYAGLNFEHIFSGDHTTYAWSIFEPRRFPMRLVRTSTNVLELRQPRTENWPLRTTMTFTAAASDSIDLVVRCVPLRDAWAKHGYIGLFFASYIDSPSDRSIHFIGRSRPGRGDSAPRWITHLSPNHGTTSSHRPAGSNWDPPLDPGFEISLAAGHSDYEYTAPFYFGVSHGKAIVFLFEKPAGDDELRFAQSPTGGGRTNPAWDFVFYKRDYRVGEEFSFRMRLVIREFTNRADIARLYEEWSGQRVEVR